MIALAILVMVTVPLLECAGMGLKRSVASAERLRHSLSVDQILINLGLGLIPLPEPGLPSKLKVRGESCSLELVANPGKNLFLIEVSCSSITRQGLFVKPGSGN